jgi:hypothetical protein
MPVYDSLKSELNLSHYSPRTLESYKAWDRQFQTYTKSKDSQLLATTEGGKCKNATKDLMWQWLFPAEELTLLKIFIVFSELTTRIKGLSAQGFHRV